MTIDWQAFTPLSALFGGAAIGLAAGLLALARGRVFGVSGLVAGVVTGFGRADDGRVGRIALLAGLIAAPLVFGLFGHWPQVTVDASAGAIVAGGLLVGFGTRLAGGCTSGHGVCGLARLSPRSLVAVATFMATAIATVFVARHLAGG